MILSCLLQNFKDGQTTGEVLNNNKFRHSNKIRLLLLSSVQKLICQSSLSQQEFKELTSLWQGDEVKKVLRKKLTKPDTKGAPLGDCTHFICFTGKKVQSLTLEKHVSVKGHDKEPTPIDLEILWVGGTHFPRITSTKVQTLTLEELYCNQLGDHLG